MRQIAILLLGVAALGAQTARLIVGTVAGFRSEGAELQIEVRPDSSDPVIARFTADTIAQKVAPGARDLNSAESIRVTDIAAGDRVLVTLEPGSSKVRRIVVMPAAEIAKRNEADRADWQKRGIGGIVAAKSGHRITVKTRTFAGEVEAVVTVDENTSFKRYAPDSVKFSDAKPSKLAEVAIGDQLRARGEKSEDGRSVKAQQVVFGTFVVKAGSIAAVDAASQQITVKDLDTNKPITVALTADSQIKQMPGFAGAPFGSGGWGRGGIPFGAGGRSAGMTGGPPGGFDINQMLEQLPIIKLEELKPGSTVVISSTKPTKGDQLTAIIVLANADMLLQMASMMSGGNRGGEGGPGMGGMMSGDLNGLASLGLSGIMQR